jgi:hypothetical protein
MDFYEKIALFLVHNAVHLSSLIFFTSK